MTFFSSAEHKFPAITKGQDIETVPFLAACTEILPFFDVLGPTAFKPVKSDINGNVTRLRKKYDTNPSKYPTLQSIVDDEIAEKKSSDSSSCTVGLLWLKRALEFIYVFMETVVQGEEDLVKCANKAYDASLRKYHGWIVRGVFSLAVKAVPYHKDLINGLKKDQSVSNEQVIVDAQDFIVTLKSVIDEINHFYTVRGQHSEATV